MRRAALALVGVLLLTTVSVALADPLDPKVKLVPADEAIAARVLLKQSDLGAGWVGGRIIPPRSTKAPTCPLLRPNYSNLTITGHSESSYENNDGIQVSADVEVWKTAKQATTHYRRMLKPKIRACIRYAILKDALQYKNTTVLPVKRMSFPKLARVSVLFRTPLEVKTNQGKVVVYSDIIFVGKGRTQIYLNVIGPSLYQKQLRAFEVRIARAMLARL